MRVKPFQALRPQAEMAEQVAALPYDVVTAEQAAGLARGNPRSFFHVTRPEIDLPPGTDPHSEAVYAKAAANFARFQGDGTLVRDDRACFYAYRQQMGDHAQNGIVACCHIEDYENKIIKQHEKTRQDKEDDRMRHMKALNANAGPVFIVHRDMPRLDRLVASARGTKPLFDFTADDGIRHTVWRMTDTGEVTASFEQVPCCYIADGHHRCAAAVRVGQERRAANPAHTGKEEYNWVMACLFSASQLKILPYNRVVRDLGQMKNDVFLGEVGRRFSVRETGAPIPRGPGAINMYLGGAWYELTWPPAPGGLSSRALDVSILQENLLAPVLGIDDPRTSRRIDFVGGLSSVEELVRRVDSGEWAVAFSVRPVAIEDVMAHSDAGNIMPPKSTWFEPKLRSGLLIHTL